MRPLADAERINAFIRELGRAARRPARLYLTGGATAVLEGWRRTTVDIDVHLEPDVDELLRSIPRLKESLGVNVELASPAQFIPELPGWRERSSFVARAGKLDVFHYDPYSQALSKLERAFDQDLEDVREMIARGIVDRPLARELFDRIEPELYRFPAIDVRSFRARVERELA
jgi:Nucleotidyltransferase of unknown function (DUF6036)